MRKLCILLVLCFSLFAVQGAVVEGIAFEDKNSNGIKDRNEHGIKNICVSNGDTVILTDKKGRFAIDVSVGQTVFPITPSKYKLSGNKIGSTNFYNITDESKLTGEIVFPLVRQEVKTGFRVAAVGDIQVGDDIELSYAYRTIFSELASRNDIDFSIFPGDFVNDNMSLIGKMADAIETLPFTSWLAAGNHDRDKTPPRDFTTYNKLFGVGDYAFNYGNVCFIILNNVQKKSDRDYYGGISDRQKRFISNTLSYQPKERLIVISQHIPMVGTQNKAEVIKMLESRKVLILSGHTHTVGKHILAPNICEQIVGSACGMWWLGGLDYDAVPLSLQQCGSPRNYFVVNFDDNSYKLNYKGIGLEAGKQMDIWVKGEEALDDVNSELATIEKNTVLVNVFGGCESTSVMMQVDNGEWQELTKTKIRPPYVSRILSWNKDSENTKKSRRNQPFRKSPSSHIWTGVLPDNLPTGTHIITVKASDIYGLDVRTKKIINIL